jgi:hypothetical protein
MVRAMRYRTGTGRRATTVGVLLAVATGACGASASGPGSTTERSAPLPRANGLTCVPKPSACGWPDSTNTGVPPGTQLEKVNGTVDLDQNGMVYSGKEVRGAINVKADNVTIQNVRLISDAPYPIRTFGDRTYTGTVVRNVEIDLAGAEEAKGIAFDNYTADRVWFHNGMDCAHAGRNVTITNSFCDLAVLSAGSSAHADGFQSDGGDHIVFRHNTIRNPNDQTSAILLSTNTDSISDVVIDNNLMSGGGYTVYCGTDSGGVAANTRYVNNVISREFFPKGGFFGTTVACDDVDVHSGNIWDGAVKPPPGGNPPPGTGGGTGGTGGPGGGPTANPPGAVAGARLSVPRGKRLARKVLGRRLGKRYKHRRALKLRCRSRSAATVACTVSWRSGAARRYKGTIVLTRTGGSKVRYRLKIRTFDHGRRGRLVKKTGKV